jgi:hypothetical protein
MKQRLATNLAILVIGLLCFFFYRQHKNVQNDSLVRVTTPTLLSRLEVLPVEEHPYTGMETGLWRDRDYRTVYDVPELVGLMFLRQERNSVMNYTLEVKEETVLFTLASSLDRSGTDGWEVLREELIVEDVYPKRSFDLLLKRMVGPGLYLISQKAGGPSKPIFYDGQLVDIRNRTAP